MCFLHCNQSQGLVTFLLCKQLFIANGFVNRIVSCIKTLQLCHLFLLLQLKYPVLPHLIFHLVKHFHPVIFGIIISRIIPVIAVAFMCSKASSPQQYRIGLPIFFMSTVILRLLFKSIASLQVKAIPSHFLCVLLAVSWLNFIHLQMFLIVCIEMSVDASSSAHLFSS